MKCKAEDPTGHLPGRSSCLIFELGKLDKNDVLVVGWFVIIPLDLRPLSIVG